MKVEKNTEQSKGEFYDGECTLIAKSDAMKKVIEQAKTAAQGDLPILLQGETGVGKDVLARAIHEYSARKGKYVPVNCAGFPKELIQSILFGHTKEAFTGAVEQNEGLFKNADQGTLFLDEITEMPLPLQAHLLRSIETGEYRNIGGDTIYHANVRIISATNRDLEEAIKKEILRRDLFYRLNGHLIHIPPLRERKKDIPPLVDYFVADLKAVTQKAMKVFTRYHWPGNVRELKFAVDRAVNSTENPTLEEEDAIRSLANGKFKANLCKKPEDLPSIEAVIEKHILDVIKACNGDKNIACNILGISRSCLYEKLKKYERNVHTDQAEKH